MNKRYISNNFKFYSYDKAMVSNIHTNINFQNIKSICLEDNNYSLLIIKILKKLTQPIRERIAFFRTCEIIKGLYFDSKDVNLDEKQATKLFVCLYNISKKVGQWQELLANMVEYLVFISLKSEGFKVNFEPLVKYKRKNIIRHNERYSRNQFDIGAHMNKTLFILGECKTSLTSYTRVDKHTGQLKLTGRANQQVKKISYIYHKILNSITKNGNKVYCNRYLFVLNELSGVFNNSPNINIIEIEKLFIEDYFLKDLGVI